MASDDLSLNIMFFLRWIHIFAGIIWIGHLYFFNFVNVPFQAVLEKELKPKVNPQLIHRALWWFRWGAMVTFVVGWILFLYKYGHGGMWTDAQTGGLSERTLWILYGGLLGTVMWFNVWFIIWPAQKLILGWVKAGQTPPEMPAVAKRALLFSRINTYLSAPLLFGMVAANNYFSINVLTVLLVTAFGFFIVWGMIRMSHKVGQVPA
jgi:uncharacterized membrane protein